MRSYEIVWQKTPKLLLFLTFKNFFKKTLALFTILWYSI